jgi:hypothetical protein
MSDLEKFIRKHRQDFDNAAPPEKTWEHIEKSIPMKKQAKIFSLRDVYKWSAAAAVFFIMLTSVYFLLIKKDSHEDPVVSREKPTQPVDISSIAPEYAAEFHQVYQSVMNRQQELKNATATQPALYQQFLQDMGVLDSSYQMLKKQAAQSPNQDVIIKAMIQNLQLQAELLGRQLMIFNQFKNSKNSNNEINS